MDGWAVLEFPYAVDMVEKTEFDTIYHEHVFYFTLTPLMPLFTRHGLEIFDVERIPIHGGSLRIFARRRGARKNTVGPPIKTSKSVPFLRLAEHNKVDSLEFYRESGADRRATNVRTIFLNEQSAAGKRIAAYGASAKGSTLLNFVGEPAKVIEFIADRSNLAKHDKLSPGLHLPIVPAEALEERQPDFALLLTWNFATEIMRQREVSSRKRAGALSFPLPELENRQRMKFLPTQLDGVWLIEPEPRRDERGFLARSYYCEEKEFSAHGLNTRWCSSSHTSTLGLGSIRGMHYQADPQPEIKLVRCPFYRRVLMWWWTCARNLLHPWALAGVRTLRREHAGPLHSRGLRPRLPVS